MTENTQNSDHPEVKWALDLLTFDPDYEPNLIVKHYHSILGTGLGFGFGLFRNYVINRPLLAGIQVHFLGSLIGYAIGQLVHKREMYVLSMRDQMYREYIIQHPEDFPEPKRQKVSELLEDWYPIR